MNEHDCQEKIQPKKAVESYSIDDVKYFRRLHVRLHPLDPLEGLNPGAQAAKNQKSSVWVNCDLRPPQSFLPIYLNERNTFGRFDCFDDCLKIRFGQDGFTRRASLWAHLRDYHAQATPLGGG